ncbi:HNH endonuclease [Bacillus testis]|uniref:HNH endonuclease n=1 Tax=Bacillus testis TaxID=1622072 RepID=UPI00067E9218|nr:HNH endonuclease [Bacillus testis]
MKLDPKADYIKVHADWHKAGIPGKTFYEKALYEVNKGYAIVVAPDAIKLTVKLPPLKERVLKRDKYTCQYCGKYGDTIDHLIPQSVYKIFTTEEMAVCACKRCNQLKSDKPMHVFIKELMKERILEMIDKEL